LLIDALARYAGLPADPGAGGVQAGDGHHSHRPDSGGPPATSAPSQMES
jgi:hypothetical protein